MIYIKKILLFLFVLLIPNIVFANDLLDLQILNGSLSPSFNKLNNKYTITLDNNETEVLFKYTVDEKTSVSIQNNYNLENNSTVTLDLISNNSVYESYEFNILKENEVEVFKEIKNEEGGKKLEFMEKNKNIIIPLVSLILIILTFKIIFFGLKKKNI